MPRNREIVGVFLGVNYVFDNGPDRRCIIGDVRLPDGRQQVTVKGYAGEDEIARGVTYRFFGHTRTHHTYGEQFQFNSFVETSPVDEDSLVAYMTQQCRGPGKGSITTRIARCLIEKFGVGAIEGLIEDPVKAAEGISRWDAGKAATAAKILDASRHTRGSKLDLIKLLDGRGFPKQTANRAIKAFGTKAAKIIRDDPYELTKLAGIGFKGADKLYCDLAREKAKTDEEYQEALAAMQRQGLCAVYEISKDTSGSTWFPIGMAKSAVTRNVDRTRAKPDEAINWAVLQNRLIVRDGKWVAISRRALHEQEIAEALVEVQSSDCGDWPTAEYISQFAPEGSSLSDHQLGAIETALDGKICCLQGSPGVGKTFAVACIAKALIKQYGCDQIAACAPTGKASVRMTQALMSNGVEMEATTIHRLLGVESAEGSDGWQFYYNDQNPLPFRFIVVDESSMIDVDLMASLLRACDPDTHLLFVGDSNQLAPVGHGRPFLDMQSIVPTGHLTEIRRNSGRIVRCCAMIRDQRKFEPSPTLDTDAGENLPFVEVADEVQVVALENLMNQMSHQEDVEDVVWDVQVITAVNDRGEVSRKPLNRLLQRILNPDGESVHGNPFRIGDKIVCLKNGNYQDAENKHDEHFVANGELGQVTALRPGIMTVKLDDPPRTITIPHAPVKANESGIADSEDAAKGAVGDWDLGYVLSCHRSQGSQWKYVIVMVDSSGSGAMVQSRNWIYTAISRAEKATLVIGRKVTVDKMMNRDGISDRKTFLVERTKHEVEVSTVDFNAIFAKV
jgi:exodeoxyribonuclease V alpha subunit